MRTQSIPLIPLFLLLIFLPGCLPAPSPRKPFLKEVHVDVLPTGRPDVPDNNQHAPLKLSMQDGPYFSGQDLSVSLELLMPVRELKEVTVELALCEAGKEQALRAARLSQLRAGKLELVLSMAGLAPGRYDLVVTLKLPGGSVVMESVSFELTEDLPRGMN